MSHTAVPQPEGPDFAAPPQSREPVQLLGQSWSFWAHMAGLAAYVPVLPGLGGVLAVLCIWLTVGKRDPEVEAHARASLNFQITVLVAYLVCTVLTLVFIGIVLAILVTVAHIALTIVASVRASRGELWNNPFHLPWVRGSLGSNGLGL